MSSPFDRLMRRCVTRFSTAKHRNVRACHLRKGVETPVEGIFDNDYELVGMEGEPGITGRMTTFAMHAAALPFAIRKGDGLRIGEEIYRIAEVQPDSEFGVVLVLRK